MKLKMNMNMMMVVVMVMMLPMRKSFGFHLISFFSTPLRSPKSTMAWPPESSYIVPNSEKDGVPSSAEGTRLLGF